MPSTAWGIALALLLLVHAASAAGPAEGPSAAQLPSATVDTAAVEPSGRAIVVPSGGDLQAALDAARPGDVVTLEPGLYITGIGGIRIEHNYLITDGGYERLSNHVIALN